MNCPPEMAFIDLLEGQLAGADAERIEQHIEACSACHALFSELAASSTRDIEPTGRPEAATEDQLARELLRRTGPAANRTGLEIGRKYVLLRLLGKGGMGAVYEAEHTGTGRRVALKLIHGHLVERSSEAVRRFRREARAAGAVDSPHIVGVLDSGEDEATSDLYLVMEHLQGEDLQHLVDREGPLRPDVALRVAAQALAGLAKAHEAGIVHRDIKPANLFLARHHEGEVTVKLLDFGIAKIAGEALHVAHTSGLTQSGSLLGSPLYMSPEQMVSSRSVDHRTDLWSLGSALYCALTGRAPFRHVENVLELAIAVRSPDGPPKVRALAPWVRPEVEEAVHRALMVDPEKRYPSAAAMLEAIRALLPGGAALREEMLAGISPEARDAAAASRAGDEQHMVNLGGSAGGAIGPSDGGGRVTPPLRKRARIGIAAAVTALIAAALVLFARDRDSPPPSGNPRRLSVAPGWGGWEAEPAISPDGRLIAYVSDEKGSPDVWVVDARGGTPRRLTDHPAEDRTPAWFPDSSAIAFASDRGGQEGIWKMPITGGTATPLLAGIDPAISPDGTRIAFVRPDARGRYLVWVAQLDDVGQAKALTSDEDGLWENRHPAWSSDGSTLAYQDHNNVWIVPASGGRARRLTSGQSGDGWPSFSPDGRHVYFSSHREDTVALWRLSMGNGQMVKLHAGTGPEVEPHVSRDGAHLAYSTYAEERTLILVDLATGTQARMPDVSDFALAPDGREVAYASNRQAHFDLWAQPLERRAPRGDPRRLTELPGTLARPAFSPDGRWIAVHRVVEGRRDIWILPATGGVPERITSDDAMHVQPVWSPDGAFLAFLSDRSGKDQVWTVPIRSGRAAGAARQITFDDAVKNLPTWSPRGDEIAYAAGTEGGSEIAIVPVAGGAPRRITSGARVVCVRWDRATGEIYASGTWSGTLMSLRRVSPSTGEAKPLDPEVSFGNVATGIFDLSLDGSTLAVRHEGAHGDIWVLDAPKGSRY